MADAGTLLATLKKYVPYVKDTPGLQQAAQAYAANPYFNTNNFLLDAQGFSEIGQGARDYFKPDYDMADQTANEERQIVQSSADNLSKAITKAYERRFQNDGYRNQGITSGAADRFVAEEETEAQKSVQTDLSTKLSNIAQRLANTKSGINRQANTLEMTMRSALAGAPQQIARENSEQLGSDISNLGNLSGIYGNLFNGSAPVSKEIYDAIARLYGRLG